MIKKCFKWIGLLALVLLGFYLSSEPFYTPTAISEPSQNSNFPRFIAHPSFKGNQGNAADVLQETLASYVEGIELDVTLSENGALIIDRGENATPLSLEEVFQMVGSQKFLFLKIKNGPISSSVLAEKLSQLIQRYYLQETVIVESFDPFFLICLRWKARDILVMYDFVPRSGGGVMPWFLKQSFIQKQIRRLVRPDILGPRWDVDPHQLKTLMDRGYPLIPWTIDDVDTAKKLFAMGVKGVISNIPLSLMQSIPQKNQSVFDAGSSESRVDRVIYVKGDQDVVNAIQEAKRTKKSISIGGRRHSMGGQALLEGSLHLNMLGLNHVQYNPENHTVTVGAGTTWKKIQTILNGHGRSIKVMQSDSIFTVGGSISANVHGWQVGSPPLASTLLSLKIVTADGKIQRISPQENRELFQAVVGGYGQLGVILEATLITVPNATVQLRAEIMDTGAFAKKFQEKIRDNPAVELAYGRLSVSRHNLFQEAGLFWYEKVEGNLEPLQPESLVALKRALFRFSQYADFGKTFRWWVEKFCAQNFQTLDHVSRNTAMNADIHILWPLYGKNKDILQEYFVPPEKLSEFLDALKILVLDYDINLLNVTIRDVRKDDLSLLSYANQDVFGVVILCSQASTPEGEKTMGKFTEKVIAAALKVKGNFYLTYRLHFTKEQLLQAYRRIETWMRVKNKWDPGGVFNSQFFGYIKELVG